MSQNNEKNSVNEAELDIQEEAVAEEVKETAEKTEEELLEEYRT